LEDERKRVFLREDIPASDRERVEGFRGVAVERVVTLVRTIFEV
jgi:hypothetical protein